MAPAQLQGKRWPGKPTVSMLADRDMHCLWAGPPLCTGTSGLPSALQSAPEAGVIVVPHAHPSAMLPAVPAEVLAIGARLAVPQEAKPWATVLAAGLPHFPAPSRIVVGVWHAGQGGAVWLHQVRQGARRWCGAAAGQPVKGALRSCLSSAQFAPKPAPSGFATADEGKSGQKREKGQGNKCSPCRSSCYRGRTEVASACHHSGPRIHT